MKLLTKKIEGQIRSVIRGKVILVTGGTGSFGKTIVAELIKYNPKQVRIYSRSEDKQDHMRHMLKEYEKMLHFVLGDVRDKEQLLRAMVGVDYVFHAAAQKQVPASEYNVLEAIKTNILGAQNVIDACLENNVKKAIVISTDKAVEPVNAMGMTKALQEKLFIQANFHHVEGKTMFSCVRYGNVIGSTGSVLPLFKKQLKMREHLTLTDRNMTRFILTLKEAADLVFLAMIESVGGEIFIPNLPSHTVIDLAEVLLEIHSEKELKILESGIRVGEKLHESLISPSESQRTVEYKGYYVILPHLKRPAVETKYKTKKRKLFRFASDTSERLTKQQLKDLLLSSDLL